MVTVERSAAESLYDDYVADTTKPTEDDQDTTGAKIDKSCERAEFLSK